MWLGPGMPLRDKFNDALLRTTGYRLTRETPQERDEAIRAAAARARRRTRARFQERARLRTARYEERLGRAKQRLDRAAAGRDAAERELAAWKERDAARIAAARAAEEEKKARIARGDHLPKHLDAATKEIILRVQPRTMTQHPELVALVEAIRYLERDKVPGEIVECGVWRGGSMQAAALALLGLGSTQRELHLFDTFEGMPPPSEHDVRVADGRSAEELLAANDKEARVWAYAGIDDVREAMAEVDYPEDKVFFHPGLVEDTVPEQAPEQIALLRLDTDWYDSTRHELLHLYDRLTPGGILILDDYRAWEGAGRATDEWIAERAEPIFLAPMAAGRIAVKPFDRPS